MCVLTLKRVPHHSTLRTAGRQEAQWGAQRLGGQELPQDWAAGHLPALIGLVLPRLQLPVE